MLKEYRRSGKMAYLDPIRGFLVPAKPEETVRQEFLQRLLGEYRVPESAIAVEYMLSKGSGMSRRRADILISGAAGRPLMVVECKEPGTPLHDGVRDQALRYAEELGCAYIAITNGAEPEVFHWDGGKWRPVKMFPSFEQMCSATRLRYEEPKPRVFAPLTAEELEDVDFLATHEDRLADDWGYRVLGADTPESLWTPIYSLYNAIFHGADRELVLSHERGGFRVEEYLRPLHFREYGNYSGGKFPGLYASFRIRDAHEDDQIYRIGFFACAHTENDPTFGNRKGTSGIHVAIDDFDQTPHMSLELSLDACLRRRVARVRGYDIVHDGKITVGRLGAAKRDALLEFVARHAPHLVRERSVILGSFPAARVLTFEDVSELVFNLLHYAGIRDRFRAEYKKRRA
jgi:hypothetical protein